MYIYIMYVIVITILYYVISYQGRARGVFVLRCVASRRVASRRVALRRVPWHRID